MNQILRSVAAAEAPQVKILPVIVAVAIRYQIPKLEPTSVDLTPITISAVRPARHHHILDTTSRLSAAITFDGEQGFLTNEGQFLNREDAFALAKSNGQLLPGTLGGRELFSEDLW